MENNDWITVLLNSDEIDPREKTTDEMAYTLRMTDFLRMPSVTFADLLEIDPDLRALLN